MQHITVLGDSANSLVEKRVIAAHDIEGPMWGFPAGMELVGYEEKDGTWKVWPPEQYEGNLGGVPALYIREINAPRTDSFDDADGCDTSGGKL